MQPEILSSISPISCWKSILSKRSAIAAAIGSDWYQVSIGGAQGNNAAIGKIIGPSFSALQMPEVIARLLHVYVRERHEGERFVDTAQRLGLPPFKEHVYATPITVGNLVGEDEYV